MDYPAFVGASYRSQSYVADQEDTINRYIEIVESQGATRKTALFPVPGFRTYATFTVNGCRGLFTDPASGRCFGVFFTTLVEITTGGVLTARGTVAVDMNPVSFCTNAEDQIFLTSGGLGYCYTLSTDTLTLISGLVATQAVFLDGYFVALDKPGNQIRLSDLYDGLVWDPTQFLARSTNADPWVAIIATPYYQLVLPGSETGDILSNVGTFPFPFAPDKSASFAEGCAATFSLQQAGKATTWVSTNKNGGYQVMAAQGFNPQRISNHALERALAGYARVDDAIAQTYEQDGHQFLLLTFPTANVTWCHDFSTQLWHKRGTWIAEENQYIYSRAVFHCVFDAMHLMGDREGAEVYEMTDAVSTDVESRPLRWLRRAPAIFDAHKRIVIHRIEFFMETGIGLSGTGQGSDPVLMIRASRDFGQTWGAERELKIGKRGEFWRRVYATRFGAGRAWVFEVSGTDPVPMRISGADVELERLAA
jgi:hypothetical protein